MSFLTVKLLFLSLVLSQSLILIIVLRGTNLLFWSLVLSQGDTTIVRSFFCSYPMHFLSVVIAGHAKVSCKS